MDIPPQIKSLLAKINNINKVKWAKRTGIAASALLIALPFALNGHAAIAERKAVSPAAEQAALYAAENASDAEEKEAYENDGQAEEAAATDAALLGDVAELMGEDTQLKRSGTELYNMEEVEFEATRPNEDLSAEDAGDEAEASEDDDKEAASSETAESETEETEETKAAGSESRGQENTAAETVSANEAADEDTEDSQDTADAADADAEEDTTEATLAPGTLTTTASYALSVQTAERAEESEASEAEPSEETEAAEESEASEEAESIPEPDWIYIDGLMPMTQEEYNIYSLCDGYYYIGASAASGSWGYTGGWCTWYVYNARNNAGKYLPNNLGNADSWPYNAAAMGYRVDYSPEVGAVACDPGNMHVMFVEKVYDDGSILVSEGGWGYSPYSYNKRHMSAWRAGSFQYIH